MRRFTTTFACTLAISTITALVGCDEQDIEDFEDIEDIEDENTELRVTTLPMAGIPADHFGVDTHFKIPMYPAAKFQTKLTFGLHFATNPSYIWTPDPTGAPGTIVTDINGAVPYSGSLPPVDPGVCAAFLDDYPSLVPVVYPAETCAEVEQGCCDHICYLWEGWAVKENGQNVTVPVDDTIWNAKEMLWGTYVDGDFMEWVPGEDDGGYPRETVCACQCKTLP